jgi:hypothetical protein
MRQSALDINAKETDFSGNSNVVVKSEIGILARKYYKEPIACNLVSYGNNIVASVKDEFREIVEEYINLNSINALKHPICIGLMNE